MALDSSSYGSTVVVEDKVYTLFVVGWEAIYPLENLSLLSSWIGFPFGEPINLPDAYNSSAIALDSSTYQSTVVLEPKVAALILQEFVEICPSAIFLGWHLGLTLASLLKPSRTITQHNGIRQ